MEKNHSLSNLHVRTKANPHVRFNKETGEVETSVTYEEIIEPIREKDMGKVKGQLENPTIEYEPFYVPVGREILDSISRVIIQQRTLLDRMVHRNPRLDSDVTKIDLWLAKMYSRHNESKNGNGAVKSGNGHIEVCEEDN